MQFPNQPIGQTTPQLNAQQLATLINLLAKSPQADPTSPQFNANYFSQLSNLTNQMNNPLQQPQMQPIVPKEPSFNYVAVKIVDDPKTIQPNEVTMGSRNLFPSGDGEKIFMKVWNTEGLIETETYIRQPKTKPTSRPKKTSEQKVDPEFSKRISELEVAISKIQKQLSRVFSEGQHPSTPNEIATPTQNNEVIQDIDIYEEETVDE